MISSMFLSAAMPLANGEISNGYQPIHWPEGHIAIQAVTGDLVKLAPGAEMTSGVYPTTLPVTREEAYFHHWTLNRWQVNKTRYDAMAHGEAFSETDLSIRNRDAGQNSGMNGPCMGGLLHFFFGGGNEIRGPAPGMN